MSDRALLIGINDYPFVRQLNGCLNDVNEMSALLTDSFGFPAGSIHTLTNEGATKDAIQSEVRTWLFEGAKPGDRRVFHFSGHGSQVDDANDPTGLDEVLCLYDIDVDRMDPGTYLTDKELGKLFAEVPFGVRFLAVFDSCHSGSATRELHAARGWTERFVPPPARVRGEIEKRKKPTVVAPKNFAERVQSELAKHRQASAAAARTLELRQLVEAPLDYVFYAACRSDQTAKDASFDDGQSHGAFSYFLTRALTSLGPEIDRSDLDHQLDNNLVPYGQQPQLESRSTSGPLFPDAAPANGGGKSEPPDPQPAPISGGLDPGTFPVDALRNLGLALGQFVAWAQQGQGGGEGRGPGAGAGARVGVNRDVTGKVLVTVHGIGDHPEGYSNGWWDALSPYVGQDLQPGDLKGKRQEVNWSKIVNDRSLPKSRDASRAADITRQIKETLRNRANRDLDVAAPPRTAVDRAVDPKQRDIDRARAARDLSIPDIGSVDDFVNYLINSSIRQRVLQQFYDVVQPLLQSGHEIEVISHSWGTVVAYEGLLNLEQVGGLTGRVHNFFTVGAALSIFAVKPLLIAAARTGRRPSMVDRWVNLNARFDVVGGNLQGNPYSVDNEYLGLLPFGCSSWLPNPVCAHSSYFRTGNIPVNRDIFAAFIEG